MSLGELLPKASVLCCNKLNKMSVPKTSTVCVCSAHATNFLYYILSLPHEKGEIVDKQQERTMTEPPSQVGVIVTQIISRVDSIHSY